MTDDDYLRLENQLCFKVYASSRGIIRLYKPLLDNLGITYPQYLVMLVLWEKDEITVNELGKQLDLGTGTLSPILKKLSINNLIEKKRCKKDERKVFLYLTKKGRDLKKDAYKVPKNLLNIMNMPKEKFLELRNSLDELLTIINNTIGDE